MPIKYDIGADRVATVTFDAPGAQVNTMTEAWQQALTATLDRLEAEKDSYDGVILASAKKTFFAGAELKDVLKLTEADGPRMFHEIEVLKKNFRRLERLGQPGGGGDQRHGARRRLRGGAVRALPHLPRRRRRSSSASPKSRWACCPARAASPR